MFMQVDMRLWRGRSRWKNGHRDVQRTSHKFFRHRAISPVDGNGWHSSVSRRTGRTERELELLRSLLRWRSRNEFSCAHTFTYYSLRSFVIPKSKAEAVERSSIRIHPIQCLLQCFCRHRRRCCYWKQLKGNVAQREVIFHWVNGLGRRRCRRYTQYPSHSWTIQRWFWTFFSLSLLVCNPDSTTVRTLSSSFYFFLFIFLAIAAPWLFAPFKHWME